MDRIQGVEEGELVFLQVAVIGQRQALQERQDLLHVSDHPRGFASNQFQHVRVPLLRHDRRAGRIRIGQLEKPEFSRTPQNPFLGPSAQMDRDQRHAKDRLRQEIAIAGNVQAVGRDVIETQQPRRFLAIDRQ